MNSPFANIYFSLLQQIGGLIINPLLPVPYAFSPLPGPPLPKLSHAASVNYIDLDYGQLDAPKRPPVSFPCVLIDFKSWKFEDVSLQVQKAQGIITIKLATVAYDNTSSIAPASTIESGISVLDIEWQLYNLLQGFSPIIATDEKGNPSVQAQPMSRITLTSDNKRPGIRIREMAFTCAYTDYSAKQGKAFVPSTINLTEEIDAGLPISL